MRTNDARCKREIQFRFVTAKATFNKKMAPFTSKMDLYLGKKLVLVHLEYSFVWCCYLHASESRSEIPGKY
jgi:hypothetical protein